MERTIKIFVSILIIFVYGVFFIPCFAEDYTLQQLTTPTNMVFADCTKTYNIPSEKLYYLTLDSIAANRFEIKEIQSKTGYILFKAADKDFLATVAFYGDNKSILKITPVNSNYYFAPGIVLNIFKYIDINYSEPINTILKS